MRFFELESTNISDLSDGDLRELVARLCEAELVQQAIQPSSVTWGGAQEAADGGLDVHVKTDRVLTNPGFVPRGNCGFQVKKNSMSKAACAKEMLDKGRTKAIIATLAEKKGAYIIVSGKDDCSDKMHSERVLGMTSAISGCVNGRNLVLDFYGRDRLAVWLRQHPGVALWVRSRLGKPLSGWRPIGRWAATPLEQDDEFLQDTHPCVIDVNSQMKEPVSIADGIMLVRERLRKSGSTVRITGLSGVGKTRFAQALFEVSVCEDALPAANVIYADLGEDLTPTASELISYLIAGDFETYVVLDNCPPDVHRKLQKQVSQNSAKLKLLTIEYDISDDRPEETQVVNLEPTSEKIVSKLVQKRFPELGTTNSDKIAEFSGGNARVAIALASRVESDETLTNLTDEELFERLFSQRKGKADNLLENAEILSLIYSFNVSQDEFNDELGVLAAIGGVERRALYRSHAELMRRQLSQHRGNWRAVLPHALANRLARRALQNIPCDEINIELFKPENLRLFRSCAHRLGYLHDFNPARHLANTWVKTGAPLHDITSCNDELLQAVTYIAPVFPETVLAAIELASVSSEFASRNNKNFSIFITLLCKIAYEDVVFDRAAAVILLFAESESRSENNNSIVGQLRHLFSLYLSGTQASPERRQAFLSRLLTSGNSRHQEIAEELFRTAFEASHWSSFATFDFGARKRDSGWQPKTHQEKLDWYTGYVGLLTPALSSSDEVAKNRARGLLAGNFRGLWSFAGCFDILEEIVTTYGRGGNWPEMWMSIKQTIFFDGESHRPELLRRLETLEALTAPSDPFSEIEAYALTNTWEHLEVRGEDFAEASKLLGEKIVRLGELAASEVIYLEKLAPKLWIRGIDSLRMFGEGLAKGCIDQLAMFEFLVGLMQEQKLQNIQPILFSGYINAVYRTEPGLARLLQERILEIPELKPHFIYLLGANPVAAWGAAKILELARSGELDAWQFKQIGYGRMHETISDSDLAEILEAINELSAGVFSTLEILGMRLFIDKDSGYKPSDVLFSAGRAAIRKLLLMHRDEINMYQLHGIDRAIEGCLSGSAPGNEVAEIIELLCEGVKTSRLYGFELAQMIRTLIKNFPELLLNHIFKDDDKRKPLVHLLFRERFSRNDPLLNLVGVDRLVKWCDGDESRIQAVATAISIYSSLDIEENSLNNPKRVVLSSHAKALLDVAKNKLGVAEIMFQAISPSSWSGSRAEILEVRSRAFAALLEHSSLEVREFARGKLNLIEQSIRRNREQEAEEDSRQEQRFE